MTGPAFFSISRVFYFKLVHNSVIKCPSSSDFFSRLILHQFMFLWQACIYLSQSVWRWERKSKGKKENLGKIYILTVPNHRYSNQNQIKQFISQHEQWLRLRSTMFCRGGLWLSLQCLGLVTIQFFFSKLPTGLL